MATDLSDVRLRQEPGEHVTTEAWVTLGLRPLAAENDGLSIRPSSSINPSPTPQGSRG